MRYSSHPIMPARWSKGVGGGGFDGGSGGHPHTARVHRPAELRSLMAAEGYEFARDVPLGDSPVWQPWHVVEFSAAIAPAPPPITSGRPRGRARPVTRYITAGANRPPLDCNRSAMDDDELIAARGGRRRHGAAGAVLPARAVAGRPAARGAARRRGGGRAAGDVPRGMARRGGLPARAARPAAGCGASPGRQAALWLRRRGPAAAALPGAVTAADAAGGRPGGGGAGPGRPGGRGRRARAAGRPGTRGVAADVRGGPAGGGGGGADGRPGGHGEKPRAPGPAAAAGGAAAAGAGAEGGVR